MWNDTARFFKTKRSLIFQLKKNVSKILPISVCLAAFSAKITPTTTPTMAKITTKESGMKNFFFLYQGRLLNGIKTYVKNTFRKQYD
jgi:hypothetical protein